MMTFQITSKQISAIHNAMWALQIKQDPSLAADYLRPVRDDLMAKKDEHEDKLREHYNMTRKALKFRCRWSMYEAGEITNESGIQAGSILVSPYTGNTITTEGSTWLDIWRAIEKLADRESDGFWEDHCFIENVVRKGDVYHLWLGS